MKNARTWLAIALLVLVVVFALQNAAAVRVNFLGFGFETRQFVLIVISVSAGIVIGKAVKFRPR